MPCSQCIYFACPSYTCTPSPASHLHPLLPNRTTIPLRWQPWAVPYRCLRTSRILSVNPESYTKLFPTYPRWDPNPYNAHQFDFKVLRNLIDMLVTCKILLPQQRWGNNILGYLLLVHVHVVLSEVVITLKRIRDFFLKFYLGRLVSIYVIIIRYVTGIESPGCTARFE